MQHVLPLPVMLGSALKPRRPNEFFCAVLTVVLVLAAGLGIFLPLL